MKVWDKWIIRKKNLVNISPICVEKLIYDGVAYEYRSVIFFLNSNLILIQKIFLKRKHRQVYFLIHLFISFTPPLPPKEKKGLTIVNTVATQLYQVTLFLALPSLYRNICFILWLKFGYCWTKKSGDYVTGMINNVFKSFLA